MLEDNEISLKYLDFFSFFFSLKREWVTVRVALSSSRDFRISCQTNRSTRDDRSSRLG